MPGVYIPYHYVSTPSTSSMGAGDWAGAIAFGVFAALAIVAGFCIFLGARGYPRDYPRKWWDDCDWDGLLPPEPKPTFGRPLPKEKPKELVGLNGNIRY